MFLPSGIILNRIVIIGLGGIGSWLALATCRMFRVPFCLVDPDTISGSNLGRQLFTSASGYKVTAFAQTVGSITGTVVEQYAVRVTSANARDFIKEGDVVFVCPDNHAARRDAALAACRLRTVAVFTAGNEVYAGNCHCHIRVNGENMTKPLSDCHPDVFDASTEVPAGPSCTNLVDRGNYQVLVTNLAVASLALDMFFLMANSHAPIGTGSFVSKWPQDGWVDMLTGNHRIDMVERAKEIPSIIRTTMDAAAAAC